MAFRILLAVYRKPEISPNEFRRLYETSHVPLVRSIAGDLFPVSHSRAYIGLDDTKKDEGHEPVVLAGDAKIFECDALTTITFETQAHYEAFNSRLMEKENGAKIVLDCAKFMDVGRTAMVVIGDVIESSR